MENFDNQYCAPNKKDSKNTCFSFRSLQKIAKNWNQDLDNNKITGKRISDTLIGAKDNDSNKAQLWKEISARLMDQAPCKQDYCLVDHEFVKGIDDLEIKYETFRPKKPISWYKNKFAWLSTTDIQHVLLQYETEYPDFEFIGPVPIDFDKKIAVGGCVADELCQLDLKKLYENGKRKIGVVFNLDPHDMPGSHWVSLFVNMNNGGIYFFDSVGKFPNQEISTLMFRIREQGNNLIKQGLINFDDIEDTHQIVKPIQSAGNGKYKVLSNSKIPKFLIDMSVKLSDDTEFSGGSDEIATIVDVKGGNVILDKKGTGQSYNNMLVKGFRLFYNDIEHQQKNTECGVYSIHFIESLLDGLSFKEYTKNIIRDNTMNKNRERLYRPSKHV